MKNLIIFAMTLLSFAASATAVTTVPTDVVKYFKKNNCSEITEFYLRPRVIEKPYIYHVNSLVVGKKVQNDYSFLAWCKAGSGTV